MKTVNIHEAKTHLSRLISAAVDGEAFVIAKAGKPLVKVIAIEPGETRKQRIGFLKDRFTVPDDFKALGREEIQALFEAGE